jgi:hypothetical protein
MHARTRPDNNLRAATGEGGTTGNSREAIAALVIEIRPTVVLGAIAALVLETRPTVVPGPATLTEEAEGTASAIDKSRIPEARRIGAPSVAHHPA